MTEEINQKIQIAVKDRTGAEVGSYEFDSTELARGINKQLLHDATVMYLANRRIGSAASKSRGMIKGSKQKMFRQKGTGRARMGNKRQPVRRGGGHTFAKVPRDFGYRMPKKAVRLATRMALLSKFLDDQAIVLSELECQEIKTKPVAEMLKTLGLSGTSCLLAITEHDNNIWCSARNIEELAVSPASDLNAYTLLRQRNLLITKGALDRLLGREQAPQTAA
ncbi:50S ribosomal protein L4 [Calycomorphotria hydatis]|uniref:Large ribosomal subunit protein uL4 n=1 Tax=Calycomorphotria hydatis TaxID=2528027 RepID=A0A517T8E2_9PLAN|nr:50S ribosomal protein L4 [Calycomorphotria hydatis]QDT64608.1 50S ribosomal protein L4 [Calycomorphotria hydatis]